MKKTVRPATAWAAIWHSRDGDHLIFEKGCIPALFRTRKDAREFIDRASGYIRDRADLRAEPHCWRMPTAVRVTISKTEKP